MATTATIGKSAGASVSSGSSSSSSGNLGLISTPANTTAQNYVQGGAKTGQATYHPTSKSSAPAAAINTQKTTVSGAYKDTPQNNGSWTGGGPTSSGYSNSGYSSFYGLSAAEPEVPAEPVDTSATKTDLLNAEANAATTNELMKNSGLDLSQPLRDLQVPDEVALPNRVDIPTTVLPNEIALPNEVLLPDDFDYEAALARAGDVNIGRVDNVNIDEERAMLNQLTEAQRQQAILQADNTVTNGIVDLQRAQQDAQEQFLTQQNQIAIDEQRALDNQALYSEAHGDRGGIGQAQYNAIQNTAATNRLTVQKEQTTLATDTARQIADLRAQGEFEKANQLLSISQNYLSQLMNLYQWAKEANIGIDEFNINVAEWEENYKLSLVESQLDVQNSNLNLAQARMAQAQQQWQNAYQQENSLYNARWNQEQARYQAQYEQENSLFNARLNASNQAFNNRLSAANYGLDEANARINAQLNLANATGAFTNGAPTYAAQQNTREVLAASGQALLEKGIIPTAEQLWAMGMTADQAAQFTGQAGTLGLASTSGLASLAARGVMPATNTSTAPLISPLSGIGSTNAASTSTATRPLSGIGSLAETSTNRTATSSNVPSLASTRRGT